MKNSQEVAKSIKDIASKFGIKTGEMLVECGISKNALSSMQQGYFPRIENIVKIAEYLHVSVDYLLGTDVDKSTDENVKDILIERVQTMSDHQADRLLGFLDAMADSDK